MRAKPRHLDLRPKLAALASTLLLLSCVPTEDRTPTTSSTQTTPTPGQTPELTAVERRQQAVERCRLRASRYPRFIPPVSHEGDVTVLPVTFPDGSTAELVYPPKLKLHRLGVQPAVSIGIEKRPGRTTNERFLLITKTDIDEFAGKGKVVESYEGALGRIRVLRAKKPKEFLHPLLIHFRVGSWNVIVGDGNAGTFMGKKNRRVWAERLHGYETDSGFIVLQPSAPLAFARGPGEPDLYFSDCFRFIELRLERCRDLKHSDLAKKQYAEVVRGVTVHRSETGNQTYANWCTPSHQVSVYLDDYDKTYVDLAVRGLRVRDVSLHE